MSIAAAPTRFLKPALMVLAALSLTGCGMVGGNRDERTPVQTPSAEEIIAEKREREGRDRGSRETIWDLFGAREDQGQIGSVNKYIWNASLETLNFLPVQTVDPFSGVIVTGFGTPPGGGRAYRATILVSDPALDARSLNLSLLTRSGPAAPETVRAIEDAILTRARQLRARDGRL